MLDTVVNRTIDQSLHTRNESFAALETEALLVREFVGNEFFKGFGPNETVQDHAFFIYGIIPRLRSLEAFSNPVTFFLDGNVNILDANGAT